MFCVSPSRVFLRLDLGRCVSATKRNCSLVSFLTEIYSYHKEAYKEIYSSIIRKLPFPFPAEKENATNMGNDWIGFETHTHCHHRKQIQGSHITCQHHIAPASLCTVYFLGIEHDEEFCVPRKPALLNTNGLKWRFLCTGCVQPTTHSKFHWLQVLRMCISNQGGKIHHVA